MGLIELHYEEGQTPLDEDEKEGLLISSVTSKGELDEVEQRNIEDAIKWTLWRRHSVSKILTEKFIKDLHKRMYGSVWSWAGKFRTTNKNLGVDKYQIGIELKILLDDCQYWVENNTYDPDEIALRFKHRIVSIHCFANGNGRHSRLIADIIIKSIFDADVFTWGGQDLVRSGASRTAYLVAIRQADQGNYKPLLSFARS